ncbi:hypothetical protein M409DRAFT_29465 [Zasmidium cellare ATCC 36951]|uniref:AIG1-type G domain-containing protein n=1 Tax=Zasmidium cellare ATCC 36951 TaxID=1080233 RepID=A0A6A6C1Y0_ZASCE|nr:uncharacterized protein M409DRAFT_29465 [Zasmidium cellare ATCC 36951]KAF2160170.1 hypothetical protein M409DRAFT_29465 [Zasmidium cellare ATCC 36951]
MADSIVSKLDLEKTSAPMILIIGQTGAGKSHFCNKVLGDDFEEVRESAHLSSCTSKPELVSAKVDGNEYLLVDTPGFNDTWKDLRRSDAKILGEIAQTLTLQSQLGVHLRGILYLYDIMAKRMTGETLRQFELIKRICGEQNYGNVLLVTTHWPERIEDQKKQHCAVREGDLRRDFWKEMIAGGSVMCRFDDQHKTAKAIIRRLASKPNITLELQQEMAKNKSLKGTSAFSFIVKARQEDEEKAKAAKAQNRPSLDDDATLCNVNLDSIDIRKDDERRLNDDIVQRVQAAIEEQNEEARKREKKASVKDIFRWIIGLSSLAMGVAQVALQC